MRRTLATFLDQDMVVRMMDKYFIEGGKVETNPFRSLSKETVCSGPLLLEAAVVASCCEVWLAKHNDDGTKKGGIVGIDRFTKVQLGFALNPHG